ncbi:MAG TPA: hypothetical protein VM032_04880, partial [Vicinamibacterales bacterium]|nr:hypothetical protein [Vicinamibacterales bacterium]
PSMTVREPVELWRSGPLVCVVVHHWDAQSFEIRVLHRDNIIERRWFDNSEDAAAFASERWRGLSATVT